MTEVEEKLLEYFDEMVVYKDLNKSNFFTSLGLPSFLRDWVLKKFEDEDGEYDIDEIAEFVQTYLPKKEEWIGIKGKIITEGEYIKILTKISIDANIRTGEITFSLPNFDLGNQETIIEPTVWESCKEQFARSNETWGVVELGYRPPTESPRTPGKIRLISFTDFCPYSVDLDYYKDIRSEFNIHEWIDVVLGAIDYNASAYVNDEGEIDEQKKLTMLSRLLPFVEKRLNLIELAPKGTGKSYVFGSVSKYGNVTAGFITRAKLFYDLSKHAPGMVYKHDYIAFDEVHKLRFDDQKQMGAILQTYMENGRVEVSGHTGNAYAGMVLLGNIDDANMDETTNMFDTLPELFKDTALIDRLHGFIKGWDIPPMKSNMKISGWGLNSEYFCSILHLLRDDVSYRAIVDKMVEFDDGAYIRHSEAVLRICTAFLKLLFPNVRSVDDINRQEFNRYCLRPAVRMRKIIYLQQALLDVEYRKPEKQMPAFRLKDI